MNTTEILKEINKLPILDQQELLDKLNGKNKNNIEKREKEFEQKMLRKGIISEIPARLPDDEFRKNFKPITIQGEPLSETIIKERN